MKPEKGIFELALEKLDMKTEECVFIDDREDFLKAPREMGFQVIHFKNAIQLEEDLRKIGVVV